MRLAAGQRLAMVAVVVVVAMVVAMIRCASASASWDGVVSFGGRRGGLCARSCFSATSRRPTGDLILCFVIP